MATIGIIGCGSIGLTLAANLCKEHEIKLFARNSTYRLIAEKGFHYTFNSKEQHFKNKKDFQIYQISDLNEVDYLFIAVKSDYLPIVAEVIGKNMEAIKPKAIISTTNGIPPWFSYHSEKLRNLITNTERRENFLKNIPSWLVLGAVVQIAAERDLNNSNSILHTANNTIIIGEPDHSNSRRLEKILKLFKKTKLKAEATNDIHQEIWKKLIGNVAFNPLSVIKQKTNGELCSDLELRQKISEYAHEAEAVGLSLNIIKKDDFVFDNLIAVASTKLAQHHSSMLQDFLGRRPLEIHPILEVVIMFAKLAGVATPKLEELLIELKNTPGVLL